MEQVRFPIFPKNTCVSSTFYNLNYIPVASVSCPSTKTTLSPNFVAFPLPSRSTRPWACCCGTNTTWSAHWPTSPTSPPSRTSGHWRTKCCSNRPSASTARASTASSRWWETGRITHPGSISSTVIFKHILIFNTQFINGLCLCVAARQADLQLGKVLLQLEEDQDQDLSDGPTGQEAGQQEGERRQVWESMKV